MATLNLDEIRSRLEAERARLRREIDAQSAQLQEYDGSPTESRYGNHAADEATDTYEEGKALALRAQLAGELNEVEHALRKIASGEYGRCEECGEEIDPERLEAMPYVRLCISCQSRAETKR